MANDSNPVRMARAREAENVRTTIVGGRPPSSGRDLGAIPRGVEILIKKAAVDPAFRERLLSERADAATFIGLTLDDAERALLASIKAPQLEAIIGATRVPPRLHHVFMGTAAAAMLAALGVADAWATVEGDYVTRGVQSDDPVYSHNANENVAPDDQTWMASLRAPANAGTVAGVVADANGDPIAGARVEITGTAVVETSTDGNGRYVVSPVSPGIINVRTEVPGYEIGERRNVTVKKGYVTAVNFSLIYVGEPCGGARPDEPGEDY